MDVETLVKIVAVIVVSVAVYFMALKSIVDAVFFAVMVLYISAWSFIFILIHQARKQQIAQETES